jgi:cytochrome oxidase Cu insertion factor (SCO1/SenC/PrrC family)
VAAEAAAVIRGAAARVLGAALFVLAWTGSAHASASAPDPLRIPLVDQHGAGFSLAALRGRPVVVTFVASRCTDACPIANAMFSRLNDRLGKGPKRAVLLTVTLDPAYDSPFVMAQVARSFQADARSWKLASGRVKDVRALMGAFGVEAQPGRDGIPDAHTSFVYVLDSHGHLARTLLLSTDLVDEATKALRGGVG